MLNANILIVDTTWLVMLIADQKPFKNKTSAINKRFGPGHPIVDPKEVNGVGIVRGDHVAL